MRVRASHAFWSLDALLQINPNGSICQYTWRPAPNSLTQALIRASHHGLDVVKPVQTGRPRGYLHAKPLLRRVRAVAD
jgi:hypothetical protein